jgi:hypothetical protein
MSNTQQLISVADLSYINKSLTALNQGIANVDSQLSHVGQEISITKNELATLQQAFADYVAADARTKEVQLAETRQVKVRQELESKYGYYDVVRRHATGILQAADISLVRQTTLESATEELMLSAPGYWLAPALVALSAWLRDDRQLAERALAEGCRRDDEKTSLFFALISRRAGRLSSCRVWLDRYFAMQDPTRLDRQAVVLIDALASGVFGPEVRTQCSKRLEEWVTELSQRPQFIAEQRQQWVNALMSKVPIADHSSKYANIAKYSPIWPQMNECLNNAGVHAAILSHFKQIFNGTIAPSPSIEAAVDELLDKLVTRFDDEELPLRRTERLLELVIDEDGNRAAAQARYDLESKSLDEEVSFTQLLTNAAMHPETSHASLATQRLAIAGSRTWIKDAHDDLTATIRASLPPKVPMKILDWQGETTDGSNEAQLLASVQSHLNVKKQVELKKCELQVQHWLLAGGGGLLMLMGLPSLNWTLILIGAACVGGFFYVKSQVETKKKAVEVEFEKLTQQFRDIQRAILAETVEWRREFAMLDANSSEVTQWLEGLSKEQHMKTTHDTARQIMGSSVQ